MSESLLIIGASGLIGSACKRHFAPHYDLLCPSHHALDALNREEVEDYFLKWDPSYVILATGLVGGIRFNQTHPADFITKNLQMQLHIFEAAHRAQVKRLVFFGSSCMYPKNCPQPMKESFLGTGPLEPTSESYALAKLAGVQMAKAYNTQYQTERFIALIPSTVYGPQDNFNPETAHVIPSLLTRFHHAKCENLPSVTLWGDGTPKREFIHSDDLARALALVLKEPALPIPLNVGVGYDVSIKELALTIREIVGYEGEIEWDTDKPNGALKKRLSHEALDQMGWQPTIDLETGIRATYNWQLKHDQIPV